MIRRSPGLAVRRITILIVSLLIAGVGHGQNSAARDHDGPAPIDVMLQQAVTARDGVELAATVWKPDADDSRFPTVLVVTPYVSDEAQERGRIYAARGYALVSLDRRGRGASGGDHEVLTDVGPDACDAIAWIKEQPWSDGRVGMRGGSYRGMTQWMTANTCPEALETIMPTASVYPGHNDFPIWSGHRAYKYSAQWLAFTAGPTSNRNLFGDRSYWRERERTSYLEHLPFHQYDSFAGAPSPIFQKWVRTISEPAKWETYTIQPAAYAAMDLPILTITGHFDGDQQGAMRYFRDHQAAAGPAARGEHYLVMGPWDHSGTRVPRQRLSDTVEFGANAAFDMDQFNLDWLDWRLGRGAKPELLKRGRIAYYVGGANEWRYADDLNEVSTETMSLYLSAEPDEARDVFRSGRLVDAPPGSEEPHAFISDPLDTSPVEASDESFGFGALFSGNLHEVWPAHLPETLVFHSTPLAKPQTVAGQMKLKLRLEMDTPDADILTTVYAIMPDGETLYLGGDVVRARFRHGLEPKLVEPGVVDTYVFDKFLWTARELPAGARIRLTVGPFNDPGYQKNYNSGGLLGFETKEDARVATIKLYHSSDEPSVLELPISE